MKKVWLITTVFLIGATAFGYFSLIRNNDSNSPVLSTNPREILSPIGRLLAVTPSPSAAPLLDPIPSQKLLIGGTHAFQTFNNCGPAALSMTLSYYSISINQQTLGQQLRPYQHPTGDNDDKSVTLQEIAAQADQFNLVAYHRPAGDIDIIKQFIAQDMPVLARTWLRTGEDIGHYRVIKGYDDTTQVLIQDDSLQGKDLQYSYEDFLDLWRAFNYEFVVLVPPEKQPIAEKILGTLNDETVAWQKALEFADTEIKTNPNDIYAHFNRVVALYYLGEYDSAISSYETVESRLPARMLWYQIEPILAYFQVGNTERVMTMTNNLLTNHNRAFSELYYLQGLIYQQQGDTVAAQTAFDQARFYNTTESWKANLISL